MLPGDDYEPVGPIVTTPPSPPPPPAASLGSVSSAAPSPNSPVGWLRKKKGKVLKLGARNRWKKQQSEDPTTTQEEPTTRREESTMRFDVESDTVRPTSVFVDQPPFTRKAKIALMAASLVMAAAFSAYFMRLSRLSGVFWRTSNFAECLVDYWKALTVNVFCIFCLIIYAIFGAMVFLYFEVPYTRGSTEVELVDATDCVQDRVNVLYEMFASFMSNASMHQNETFSLQNGTPKDDFSRFRDAKLEELAEQITRYCVPSARLRDERTVWNLKNTFLFSFGIMTTLGYSKIEPQTVNGRIFTVIYGFIGVPFTVILLTNFMRYLLNLERTIRRRYYIHVQRHRRRQQEEHKRSVAAAAAAVAAEFNAQHLYSSVGNGVGEDAKLGSVGNHRSGGASKDQVNANDSSRQNGLAKTRLQPSATTVDLAAVIASMEEFGQISMCTLIGIVVVYLLVGGALMMLFYYDAEGDDDSRGSRSFAHHRLSTTQTFLSGIYYAFIALIHIEYGNLISPKNSNWFLPIAMCYICLALSISGIALRVGSAYVKRLYYYGRRIGNIASVKIRFGAKNLQVQELLTALGRNIGLEPRIFCDLDLEKLVAQAIEVKEGRMERVPQSYIIADGIWPPELVPLFIKDGGMFPLYVDAEEEKEKRSIWSSFRNSLRPSSSRAAANASSPSSPHGGNFVKTKTTTTTTTTTFHHQQQHKLLETDLDRHRCLVLATPPRSFGSPPRSPAPTPRRRAPPAALFKSSGEAPRFHELVHNRSCVRTMTTSEDSHEEYRTEVGEQPDANNVGGPTASTAMHSTVIVNPLVAELDNDYDGGRKVVMTKRQISSDYRLERVETSEVLNVDLVLPAADAIFDLLAPIDLTADDLEIIVNRFRADRPADGRL